MNVWHICIVNHLSKKVKILLFVWSSGVICTKQGASISSHSFPPVWFYPPLGPVFIFKMKPGTCKHWHTDADFCSGLFLMCVFSKQTVTAERVNASPIGQLKSVRMQTAKDNNTFSVLH